MTDQPVHSGLLWISGIAFFVSLALTPIFRDIFRAYNVMDRPGARKVHVHPIPRVGGFPIAIAYALALVSFFEPGDTWLNPGSVASRLLPGAMLIFAVGVVDDLLTLQPVVKLIGQVIAAAVTFLCGLRIEMVAGIEIHTSLSFPLTVLWLLLTTNALNLIDGLDGLCAGMGLFATLTLFAAGLLSGNEAITLATLPLAAALLGFLFHNFSPATVFLGDSGALLTGFLLGCFGMIWSAKTATLISLAVPLLSLTVPLLDLALSIFRRFVQKKPIFSADRGHIHHRLLDRGFSPRRAVLVLYLFSAVAAATALLISKLEAKPISLLMMPVFASIVLLAIQQLGYAEFKAAGRFLFGGGIRGALDSSVRLESLRGAIKCATCEDEWWTAIVDAARDAGWNSVSWVRPALATKEVRLRDEPSDWSFQVILPRQETLIVTGRTLSGLASPDLTLFAKLIEESCRSRVAQEQTSFAPQESTAH